MPKRSFIVKFKSGDEQSFTAEKVVEEEEYLIFLNPSDPSDGLAGLALRPEVKEWHEGGKCK
jgi:hypothetical protein